MKAKVVRNFATGGIDIYVYEERPRGVRVFLVQEREGDNLSLQWIEATDDYSAVQKIKPMLSVNNHGDEFAQSLLEELSVLHLRTPNEHTMEGQMLAMGRHLDDMRAIAFQSLKFDPVDFTPQPVDYDPVTQRPKRK